MTTDQGPETPDYLTTREVAEILRVKERKVYDLAGMGEIPHRRITGKLLFPRRELLEWIEGDAGSTARPAVLVGSHDPLLDWALRECGAGLATLFNGSRAGLECFAAGEAALTGLHIPDADGWNVAAVADLGLRDCVLLGWAARARGLLLGAGMADRIGGVGDLRAKRVVRRQPGAGGATFFDAMLAQAGMRAADLNLVEGMAHTEHDAAAIVAAGDADAATGIEAMARQFSLGFLPLAEEHFDLLIDRRAYFTPAVQKLMTFAQSAEFRDKAEATGGYDLAHIGRVRWLSE